MDEDGAGGPSKSTRTKSSGDRCMVMSCGTTFQTGTVHRAPGKMPAAGHGRFSPLQRAWINFIQLHRVFDPRQVKYLHVCNKHFDESQYNQTQVRMHTMGLRSKPPQLLPDAVPHIYTPGASPRTSKAKHHLAPDDSDLELCPTLIPSNTPSLPAAAIRTSKLKKRRRASYFRKKEVDEITNEYVVKEAEGRLQQLAKDIQERSKGHQCTTKMVDRRVGNHTFHRTCKIQVQPITVSKGSQADYMMPQTQNIQVCDATTQTVETSSVVPSEDFFPEEPDEELAECEEEESDDEMKDPTYRPDIDSPSPVKEMQTESEPKSPLAEEKYIVFESNLLELFDICQSCLSKNVLVEKISPKSYGSQLQVTTTCISCGHVRNWYSQPKIGNVMAGNLLLSAGILFGGGSPTKILRCLQHMNLKAISVQTFLQHQREYLQPAIIRVAKAEQSTIISQVEEGEKLVLGGDGRADSPGHCAKFGSYTLMDLRRNKIIDVQLVQSNEVSSSNEMEKEGLSRALASLYDKGVAVGTLVTDRHAQVNKWLRDNYPDIDHRFDIWHIAKGLKKKITAVSKLKECEVVGRWKKSITNHLYWCAASTPTGDGDVMAAKFASILNHVRNVHDGHGDIYPTCTHEEQYWQREWMRQGTKPFEKMSEELTKTRLKNDVRKMSHLQQTGAIEAFHSVLLYWCPKMLAYSYAGMVCRLQLASLHWNENAGREQATKADGTAQYRISYSKAKEGGHVVSKVLTACTFNYVTTLMNETIEIVRSGQKLRGTQEELRGRPPLCSALERVDKEEAVQQALQQSRFAHGYR